MSPGEALRGPEISCSAPAKLNLYLHVTGRRADGLHDLDSLFVFLDVGDRVAVTPKSQLVSLCVEGPFATGIPAGPENLVLRAADALARAARPGQGGGAIRLTKNLPPASGIGGGSADAAATLRLLDRLWGSCLSERALAAIAAGLGADIPACLACRGLQASGSGTSFHAVGAMPDLHFVLANPAVPVSTAAVFDGHARAERGFSPATPIYPAPAAAERRAGPRNIDELVAALARRGNDLEAAACALAPAISTALTALAALNGCRLARMSGSGATCFGIFASRAPAEAGAARLSKEFPDWWVVAARMLTRRPRLAGMPDGSV